MRARRWLLLVVLGGCAETRGTKWMSEPLSPDDFPEPRGSAPASFVPHAAASGSVASPADAPAAAAGRTLGVFRNTYYDFPSEAEFSGPTTKLMSASCAAIADVPRGFYEAVCVQGSGTLRRGATVSFAKRDCPCADVCPRTGQKICFEALDPEKFPWGRGASGRAIVPLVSVAVDTSVIPLGTPVHLAEFDGLPIEEGSDQLHDGCFLADDRGGKVSGLHVDVFTGTPAATKSWNALLPSNHGVTVRLDVPKCERLRR